MGDPPAPADGDEVVVELPAAQRGRPGVMDHPVLHANRHRRRRIVYSDGVEELFIPNRAFVAPRAAPRAPPRAPPRPVVDVSAILAFLAGGGAERPGRKRAASPPADRRPPKRPG